MRNHSSPDGNGNGGLSAAGRGPLAWLIPVAVIALTLFIYAGAILIMTEQVRLRLHEGILREDGEVLLAAVNQINEKNPPAESVQELLTRLLEASDFRDKEVWAVRLFDQDGKYVISFPHLQHDDLSEKETERVKAGEVLGKFDRAMNFREQFFDADADLGQFEKFDKFMDADGEAVGPVETVTIPIETGSAQYLLLGERVGTKLAAMDADVKRYTAWVCVGGGSLIALGLAWAFGRLHRTNKLLADRTANLLRANHELTLAAKTSALGAVAAHLIHGLKNPLFGLQMLVTNQLEDQRDSKDAEWRIAADATRRMQSMIADIVRILREDAGDQYELSVAELVEILSGKVKPMGREKDVKFSTRVRVNAKLANREANLVILSLTNLIQNAMQASKAGSRVELDVLQNEGVISFDVIDQAGGVPKAMRDILFTPCQSTKPGGTGLGLAITKQLANHMGGQLELVESNAHGSIFRLSIPLTLFLAKSEDSKMATSGVA